MEKKIEQAIKLLQTTTKNRGTVELAYSGGKDSDVCLELCKMAGIDFRAIYKCTTIDPPGTIAHVKSKGAEIVMPKKNMKLLLQEKGMPNRVMRFCCAALKEYKILDTCILGVRKEESVKRRERYSEPTRCRAFSKKEIVYQIYPILHWSDEDVERFINMRQIKCHPLYYDANGKFHVERRLGCQGCPLMSKNKRIAFFKENPRWLKFWIGNAARYIEKKEDGLTYSVYDMFVALLFYKNKEDMEYHQNGLFGRVDSKKFLEDFFCVRL